MKYLEIKIFVWIFYNIQFKIENLLIVTIEKPELTFANIIYVQFCV